MQLLPYLEMNLCMNYCRCSSFYKILSQFGPLWAFLYGGGQYLHTNIAEYSPSGCEMGMSLGNLERASGILENMEFEFVSGGWIFFNIKCLALLAPIGEIGSVYPASRHK